MRRKVLLDILHLAAHCRNVPVTFTLDRKKMPTKAIRGSIKVDGTEYHWEVSRVGGSSNMYENYRGLAVVVVLEPGRTKELRIEFPFREYRRELPEQKSAFEGRLQMLVRAAIAAGWQPVSRGRPFVFEAENAV